MGLRDRIRRLEDKAGVIILVSTETGEEITVHEDADLDVVVEMWARTAPGPHYGDRSGVVDLIPLVEHRALVEKATGKEWPHFP